MFILAFVIAVFGILLCFTNVYEDKIAPSAYRNIMGIVLMLWGTFRGIIAWQKYSEFKRKSQD